MGLRCLFAQADKHVSSQKLWAQPTYRPATSLLQSHRGLVPPRAGAGAGPGAGRAVPWPSCLVLGAAGCGGIAWLLRDAGGCLVLQDAGCLAQNLVLPRSAGETASMEKRPWKQPRRAHQPCMKLPLPPSPPSWSHLSACCGVSSRLWSGGLPRDRRTALPKGELAHTPTPGTRTL